jgi:hypothetical protein
MCLTARDCNIALAFSCGGSDGANFIGCATLPPPGAAWVGRWDMVALFDQISQQEVVKHQKYTNFYRGIQTVGQQTPLAAIVLKSTQENPTHTVQVSNKKNNLHFFSAICWSAD